MRSVKDVIETVYSAFNARRIDDVLAYMQPDVHWPNGMEGGWVDGHESVRAYWLRQWKMIDPKVEPQGLTVDQDGGVVVSVHQLVRDLAGNVLADETVQHVYRFRDGLISEMEIRKG